MAGSLEKSEEIMVKTNLTRAFIAVEFSDEVIKEIARVQGLLEKTKFMGKLTELENLHLTLKFLGEINEETLGKAKEKLKEIRFDKMKLKLGKIGTFSIHGDPSIIWIKVEGAGLYELQKKIDESLKGLFASEERFMGHLTIARVKYVKDKKNFLDKIGAIHVEPIAFDCLNFKLKESELKAIGPVYTDLEEYPFSGKEI
jgi:2'-5' RNA ligase